MCFLRFIKNNKNKTFESNGQDSELKKDKYKCLFGKRVTLVPITNGRYAKDCFQNFTSEVTKYMYPIPAKNFAETKEVFRKFAKERRGCSDFVYAITLPKGDKPDREIGGRRAEEFIGCVGLHNLNDKVPELGIWTKIESHSNHYGREAIGVLIDFARGKNIKKLVYPVDKRNIASMKIPEAFGGVVKREEDIFNADKSKTLQIVFYEIDLQ